MPVSLMVAKRRWDTFYQAIFLARRGAPWGLRLVGPRLLKALLFVRREEAERGVQGWDCVRAENLFD